MLINLFFCFTIVFILAASKYYPRIIIHGKIKEGISKNYFVYFYLYGLIFSYVFYKECTDYSTLLLRRFIESIIFKYKSSKMNVLQFTYGFIFYTLTILEIKKRKMSKYFYILNFLQFLSHLYIFNQKRFRYKFNRILKYSHYFLECLIYLEIFNRIKNIESFLVFIYVITFTFVTISQRNKKICLKKQ